MAAGLLVLEAAPTPAAEPAAAPPPPVPSSAGEDPAPAALPRTRIIVGVAAHDPSIDQGELAQVLAGHFADTGLHYRVASLAGGGERAERAAWASSYVRERDVLAVFWIEASGDERSLYLFEPKRGTTWVRELPASSDPDELLESLGTMLRSISLWLEDGALPDMVEVEAEPAEPEPVEPKPEEIDPTHDDPTKSEPAVPPSPPPRATWALELAYAGGNLADLAPWQSGASLGLELEWPSQLVGQVALAALSPAELRPLPATTVWRLPLHVAAGYRFRAGRALRPMLDAAVVVEPMWWQAQTTPEVVGRSGRTARVAIAPGVGLRWTIRGGLGLMVHARADLRVLNADLVVSQQGRRVSRLSPHIVAAFARAGLSYAF